MARVQDAAGNLIEFIRQPLYDLIQITTTGTEFRYFASPQGQAGKTFWWTNMLTAAQLAVPKSQLVDGFRVVPTSNVTDANQKTTLRQLLWNQTWCYLEIGGLKDYLVVPLWYIPAGVGIPGFADQGGLTTATAMVQVSNGAPVHGNFFGIRTHPVLIPSQQTFAFVIKADAALASLPAATYTWVVLEGVNGRETM